MKKLITLLVFVFVTTFVFAQNMGSIKVQNFGSHYRLSVDKFPKMPNFPTYDSLSIKIRVICQATWLFEETLLPKNGYVDYQLGSYNYVGITVIRWKKVNGVYYKLGQTNIPTVCIFGLNPLACYQKQ